MIREAKREYDKERYSANQDKLLAYAKEYQAANREEIRAYKKEHYAANKDKLLAQMKEYRAANQEKIRAYEKEYQAENKEKIRTYNKERYAANKDKIRAKNKKYHDANKEKANKYQRNRRATDLNYRIACNLRTRLRNALKGNFKTGSGVRDLGCSIDELKLKFIPLFAIGMNWENYGSLWHIDHIRPCSSFDLTDPVQLKQCCHFSNLQPLWAADNLAKSDRY